MNIYKKYCLMVFVLLLMTSIVYVSNSDAAEGSSAAVDNVAESVLSYFTPMNGVVDSVDSGLATVKLGNEVSVNEGMRLSVFRKGAPFYHPVTKELIGESENYIGRVEVNEKSKDGLYACRIISGSVKAGDPVRITSAKIKLAFFQDRKANWAMSELFYNTLKDSGRFDILEAYTSSYETDHLSGIARGLGADAVLMFSTPQVDGKKFLNAKLFWANETRMFADIAFVTGSDINEMIKPYEEFIIASGAGFEPWGSFQLERGQLIAMGDVDGNGENEFVVSNGNILKVYTLKDELQEVWEIKGARGEKHISIDIYDANGNGVAEIFVTSLTEGDNLSSLSEQEVVSTDTGASRLSSYVVEFDPSAGYHKIADNIPFFFRAAGRKLLMQRYTSQRVFSSNVYETVWQEGEYLPGYELHLPDGVNIYGFAYIDWQEKGQQYVVSFDDKGYLTMYDAQNNGIWQSRRTYGKPVMSFKKKSYSLINPIKTWFVRGRLFPVKTERGQEVIVVNRVPMVSKLPGLGTREAEVYSLWWDGSSMQENLVLSDISGKVTDYLIEGNNLFLLAKGTMVSLAKNAFSGNFVKGSVLYYYSFGKK